MKSEILKSLETTRVDLQKLDDKINDIEVFDEAGIRELVSKLNTDCHKLANKLKQDRQDDEKTVEITSLDEELKNELLRHIDSILHSPEFNLNLGSMQVPFIHTLHDIQNHVRKWTPKVVKTHKS